MSNIKDQNDWAEFRNHINREMDKQVTSNKALLWAGMTFLLIFNIATLCIALTGLLKTQELKHDVVDIVNRQVKLSTSQVILENEVIRRFR